MVTKKLYLYREAKLDYEAVFDSPIAADPSLRREYVLIGVCEAAEFTMKSDAEQTRAVIERLEAERLREMADSQARIDAIDARIQSLLAITHEPETGRLHDGYEDEIMMVDE